MLQRSSERDVADTYSLEFYVKFVGTITFTVFIDPITWWRHLSPREEGD